MRRRRQADEQPSPETSDASEQDDDDDEEEEEDEEKKKGSFLMVLFVLSMVSLPVVLFSLYMAYRLGPLYLLPKSFKTLSLTEPEVDAIISNHSFLFIGGPHRGGTTIVWRSLRQHPSIRGFADNIGADFSEGQFLQSVYPHMGIGGEDVSGMSQKGGGGMASPGLLKLKQQKRKVGGVDGSEERGLVGLGKYAFHPAHHLTEESELCTVENQRVMMNEWGFYWGLGLGKGGKLVGTLISLLQQQEEQRPRQQDEQEEQHKQQKEEGGVGDGGASGPVHMGEEVVLLEKSPPNMIVSRFLQRMFTPGLSSPGGLSSQGGGETKAKFLFVSRHPIAHALALGQWLDPTEGVNTFDLVLHWVASHEIMTRDMDSLAHSHLVRLEDFVKEPQHHVAELFEWLGLPPFALSEESLLGILPDPNSKYHRSYCLALRRSEEERRKHGRLVAKLNARVLPYGYDLRDYDCR